MRSRAASAPSPFISRRSNAQGRSAFSNAKGPTTSPASPSTVRHGFSGFGPRNAMLFKYVVLTVLAERERLRQLGDSDSNGLHMEFCIFEMQNEDHVGSGNSFQNKCDATINTCVTPSIPIINSEKIPAKYKHIVELGSDLASIVTRKLESSEEEHRDELRKRNSAAYALFGHTMGEDGKLDTSRACTTRGTVGKVQADTIRKILDFVEEEVPEIKVEFFYGHTVVDADFSSPTKPKLFVRRNGDAEITSHTFDFVHLAHGTTWESPVSQQVAPKSFSGISNYEAIRDFLQKHDLLDKAGYIKKGSKIGITGMSLSAYDPVAILLQFTPLVHFTDRGYEFDEHEAQNYKGLFTFISRSDGIVAPPRHAHSKKWLGKHSFLSTKEAHIMLLQRKFDWLSFVNPILHANISYEVDMLPTEVNRVLPTEERMRNYHQQSVDHVAGKMTEIALLRAGYQALIDGYGFDQDPETADKELLADAPLSREDRGGWPMRRSAGFDMSLPEVALVKSNSLFFDQWKIMHAAVTASPFLVQDQVAQLFNLGVATHATGLFEEIDYSPDLDKVQLGNRRFDVLFAPRVLTAKADVLLTAIRGKVKEVVPSQPEYVKGRFLQTPNGTPIHATDIGSGGHGVSVDLPDGTKSMVGIQWQDTNDHISGACWAVNASRMLVLLSCIKASGVKESAVELLLRYYKETSPSTDDYDAEITRLEPTWIELCQKQAFLKVCEQFAAKDGIETYRSYVTHVSDQQSRDKCIDRLAREVDPEAKIVYQRLLDRAPPYKPVSRDEFLRRFVDITRSELDRVWNHFFDQLDLGEIV